MDQVTRSRRWECVPDGLRRLLCLLLALSVVAPVRASAADERLEYQVKAAFLLNFTKFIEWPASAFDTPDSPIVICVLGDDPFGKTLDQIVAGEVVGGRKIVVQRIKRVPPPKSCQELFVYKQEKEVLKSLSAVGPGILTIGEGESFVRDGGMIAFVVENRRVRFGINGAAAASAGLKLSSKLLNVAKSVEE